MPENKLLNQYENVIAKSWSSNAITESYDALSKRELFEIAYHTSNSVTTRLISLKLAQSESSSGSTAILYSKNKTFTNIESLDDFLKITMYYGEDGSADKLINEISPIIKQRKDKFNTREKDIKTQLLKTILVERKIDECTNLVLTKDINRKVYFAIGDARESAAVVPIFMEAEGASLVQLALNKWMSTAQNLEPEKTFPENQAAGLLKNLMQIKKWVLNLLSVNLDK